MNRREFTKLLFLASATTLIGGCQSEEASSAKTSGADQSANSENAETILIVGAGMAGIAAARTLTDAGYEVIVLEGRDRIGGRLWTSRMWENVPMDLGASWIHGEDGNPLTDLADEIDAPRAATDSNNFPLYDFDGSLVADRIWGQIEGYNSQFEDALEEAAELDQDISVQRVLDEYFDISTLSPKEQRYFKAAVSFFFEQDLAADTSKLSAHHFDEGSGFGGDEVIFLEGYDALVHYLAEGQNVRLNEVVTDIEHDETGVTVRTNSGTFEANRVLVTLPIGVLKAGKVAFDPPLPEKKQAAIDVLGLAVLNKLYLQFDEPFWQRSPDWITYIPEEKGIFMAWYNFYRATKQPILAGFNVGDFARELEALSDEQIVAQAMDVLRVMYGADTPDPLNVQITRWANDPFALCSYSAPAVGMTDKTRADLAAPIDNRVFFAGEATHSDYPATVHGAYLSGLREAKRIQESVG